MSTFKKISQETDNPVVNIALDTMKIGKQALVFVNTKSGAEKAAEEIAKKIKGNEKELILLSDMALNAIGKPTKQCQRLSECLRKGIAFHHAGLAAAQREIVEDNFRQGRIKVICSTPTLAAGIDMPAFRTIIRDLKRYSQGGMTNIPVLEYRQMAGRAGRPKFDSYGEAITIAPAEPEKRQIFDKYILGEPEDIYSKLAVEPALRTYLLSLIAANFIRNRKEIIEFFSTTFWAHQFRDMNELESRIRAMLELLEGWEFIIMDDDDFKVASEINDFSAKATLIGKRVAELYIDPLTAHYLIECLKRGACRSVNEFSLLQMISHTLELRPLLSVRTKDYDKVNEKLIENSGFILESEPSLYEPEYSEFLSSVKTATMLESWINEKDEDFLMEEYNVRPGELRAKLDISEWLLFSADELVKLLNFKPLLKEIAKLRLRVKYGVKEELLTLLRLKHIGRARARKLYSNRIRTIEDVKSAKLDVLGQILGKNVAIDVKRQVGEEIKAVPEGKRKGQINLNDY